MTEYRLGEYTLTSTPGRDDLADLRQRYARLGEMLSKSFVDRYSAFITADELFTRFPQELETALTRTVSSAMEDIASERIYHWDEASLREQLEASLKSALGLFEQVHGEYLSIVMLAKDREVLRAEGAGARPSIIGGGFGVDGATQGIFAATAANAAIGLLYGAAGAAGKAISTTGDKRRKADLFQAETTKSRLAEVLRLTALAGHSLVANLVNNECDRRKFDLVTEDDSRRATALSENVSAGRVPREEAPSILINALNLNPFLEKPWELWVEHLGDADGSVERAAKQIGMFNLEYYKHSLVDSRRQALSWSTPEECAANALILEAEANSVGAPFEAFKADIQSLSFRLDQQRRTFGGEIFDSVEAASMAKMSAEDAAQRTFAGKIYQTPGEAEQAKDIAARTYGLTVYETRQQAMAAQENGLRSVSLFYWVSVIIAPFPSALLSLRRGFSLTQRLVALGWMAVCSAVIIYLADIYAVTGLAILGIVFGIIGLIAREGEVALRMRFARSEPKESVSPSVLSARLASLSIAGKRIF